MIIPLIEAHLLVYITGNFIGFGVMSYGNVHSRFVRRVTGLSLAPLTQLDEAWLQLDADSPPTTRSAPEQLDRFKTYFIQTWMESAVYPREMWNHFK